MNTDTPITVAYGDGIGPEIMTATLKILAAAKAKIAPEIIVLGAEIYHQGNTTGIPEDAWQSLQRTKVLLKSPITTPQGGGYKSLNVTLRKTLGLFANVRSNVAYAPYVATKFPQMDLVIIRENEEDIYTGIEHRPTAEVYESLKLVSRPGCEKIIRYAFAYARQHNRRKVTCMSKDNIMKLSDGIFHQVFNEIASEYPDISSNHYIIDIGAALIASDPLSFDVIVTSNLYGDIISDIAAQVAGSVGLAGSANVGEQVAMFEAIHGSAPDIAGKNCANPSGLLNAAIQLLVHIKQPESANLIANAWLKTLEDGIHTADIYQPNYSKELATTESFAAAVIARLGCQPQHFKHVNYQQHLTNNTTSLVKTSNNVSKRASVTKKLIGVDISLAANDTTLTANIDLFAAILLKISSPLNLISIASRGLQIWPNSIVANPYLAYYTCRCQTKEQRDIDFQAIIALVQELTQHGIAITKIENLYTFNDELGFTLFQGQ
jgi:isocitrate dehydrogenase